MFALLLQLAWCLLHENEEPDTGSSSRLTHGVFFARLFHDTWPWIPDRIGRAYLRDGRRQGWKKHFETKIYLLI